MWVCIGRGYDACNAFKIVRKLKRVVGAKQVI